MHLPARLHAQLLLIVLCWLVAVPAGAEQQTVSFSWALLTDTENGPRELDTSVPVSLALGDTVQFYFDCRQGAYVYLFLEDAAGTLSLLHPKTALFYDNRPPKPESFRIPASPERFRLVPPAGQDRLHLLVSPLRLTKLEGLTAAFLAAPEETRRQAAVIQEIKRLKRRYSELAQPPETSIPVAGTIRTRGAESETGGFSVVQVSEAVFYSRTIRINHQ